MIRLGNSYRATEGLAVNDVVCSLQSVETRECALCVLDTQRLETVSAKERCNKLPISFAESGSNGWESPQFSLNTGTCLEENRGHESFVSM